MYALYEGWQSMFNAFKCSEVRKLKWLTAK